MKLFSATEVASKREVQSVAEIKRLETVSKGLIEKRRELEALEADFEFALKAHGERWEREMTEYTTKINALKAEVIRLEERRKQNLFPLEEKFEQVEDMSKKLAIREAEFAKKVEDFDERSELLEEKLTEVGERETEVARLSRLQNLAQQGIDTQKAQITLQAKEMNKKLSESLRDIREKENEISRLEATLSLKEKALADKEADISKREAGFAERERAIQDRYATLERAIKHHDSTTKGQ